MTKAKVFIFYLLLPFSVRGFIKNKHGEVLVSPDRSVYFDETGSVKRVKNGSISSLRSFLQKVMDYYQIVSLKVLLSTLNLKQNNGNET